MAVVPAVLLVVTAASGRIWIRGRFWNRPFRQLTISTDTSETVDCFSGCLHLYGPVLAVPAKVLGQPEGQRQQRERRLAWPEVGKTEALAT